MTTSEQKPDILPEPLVFDRQRLRGVSPFVRYNAEAAIDPTTGFIFQSSIIEPGKDGCFEQHIIVRKYDIKRDTFVDGIFDKQQNCYLYIENMNLKNFNLPFKDLVGFDSLQEKIDYLAKGVVACHQAFPNWVYGCVKASELTALNATPHADWLRLDNGDYLICGMLSPGLNPA